MTILNVNIQESFELNRKFNHPKDAVPFSSFCPIYPSTKFMYFILSKKENNQSQE